MEPKKILTAATEEVTVEILLWNANSLCSVHCSVPSTSAQAKMCLVTLPKTVVQCQKYLPPNPITGNMIVNRCQCPAAHSLPAQVRGKIQSPNTTIRALCRKGKVTFTPEQAAQTQKWSRDISAVSNLCAIEG